MLIHNIKLQNFRAFETLEVKFDSQMTVLVGENGVGKTTVLEAAAIAAGTFFYSLDGIKNTGIKKMIHFMNNFHLKHLMQLKIH